MPTLLALFIFLIVACVIWWGTVRIMAAFGIGDPIATVVQVVLVILILFALLDALGVANLGLVPRLR